MKEKSRPCRFAVAPMMDWTDRHCRYFMRLLSPGALLYTEMVTANAIHFGDAESLLRYDMSEHPIAVQLGGSDPALMAELPACCRQWAMTKSTSMSVAPAIAYKAASLVPA